MNWADTIALIKEAGYSQPQIAEYCKCGQSTISELATGTTKEPRYSTGQALQQLAAKAKRKLAERAKVE